MPDGKMRSGKFNNVVTDELLTNIYPQTRDVICHMVIDYVEKAIVFEGKGKVCHTP